MSRLAFALNKIEETLTKLLLASIVLLVFYSAMVRWAGFPVAWSVEMAQLLFIWLVFIGANQALRKNRHIGVDFFTSKLSSKGQLIIQVFTNILIGGFLLYCIYFGFVQTSQFTLRSIQNLPLSYSYITASVPVGCSLMFITLVSKWVLYFINKDGSTKPETVNESAAKEIKP